MRGQIKCRPLLVRCRVVTSHQCSLISYIGLSAGASANTVQDCIRCLQLCPRHRSGTRLCTDDDALWPCRSLWSVQSGDLAVPRTAMELEASTSQHRPAATLFLITCTHLPSLKDSTGVQGRSDGGISVYIPPKSVYLTNFYVVTGCFFYLTQDKLLLILKLE